MDARRKRLAIAVACVCCALALTGIMGWFVGRFLPGEPAMKQLLPGPEDPCIVSVASGAKAEDFDVVEYGIGTSASLSGLTVGSDVLDDDAAIVAGYLPYLGDDAWAIVKGDGAWRAAIPNCSLRVADARAVSEESLIEWFPRLKELPFILANYEEYQTKYVVVEMEFSNASQAPMTFFIPWLWGDSLMSGGVEGAGRETEACTLGVSIGRALIEELYGEEVGNPNSVQHELQEGWDVVEPGRTRTFTLIYPLYRSMLPSQEAFDGLDMSQLYLQVADGDLRTLHRLRLG